MFQNPTDMFQRAMRLSIDHLAQTAKTAKENGEVRIESNVRDGMAHFQVQTRLSLQLDVLD